MRMTDKHYLKDRVQYVWGDDTASKYTVDFGAPQDFDYPASVPEAAADLGLNYFRHPGGQGFALNFNQIDNIFDASSFPHIDGYKCYSPIALVRKLLERGYTKHDLSDKPYTDKGAGIAFKRGRLLFIPLAPMIINFLRTRDVDPVPYVCRPEIRQTNLPPSATL